jgi:hypothetical protein
MRPFWRWLALFAYRRWARPGEPKPVGIPGNRDPDHPCPSYEPRPRRWNDFADCMTDGHYLCKECCHRDEDHDPDSHGRGEWIKITTH